MKIRNGFVSNSSSSSFVLVVLKDEYDKVRTVEDPIQQAIMDASMGSTKVLGQSCMIFDDFCSNGGDGAFEYVDKDEIVKAAKALALAQGRPVCSDSDYPTDPSEQDAWLHDTISDGIYYVKYKFKNVPEDKKWSHSQDW